MPGRSAGLVGVAALLLAACTSTSPTPTSAGSVAPFAGRTYGLDLPAGWVRSDSPAYDRAIDSSPAVAAWLNRLDLLGQNDFRAYEPMPAAGGLRLAINPVAPWRQPEGSIFQAQQNIEALPGTRAGSVSSVWVATDVGKGFGYEWIEELDWGGGTAAARSCIGWAIYTEFEPVNVVFSYPAGTNPAVDIKTLMASFRVTGNPTWSLPPRVTMPPSPTPFDKEHWTPGPVPTYHSIPDLEVLLPDAFEGRSLWKQSRTGEESGLSPDNPLLAWLDKQPADYATAQATANTAPLLLIAVVRVRGVSGEQLLTAVVKTTPSAQVSTTRLVGRPVTVVRSGAWPVWYWPTGDLLYGVVAIGEDEAGRVLAILH